MKTNLAFIGGSGLYQLETLSGMEEFSLPTPFGEAKGVIKGTLFDKTVFFLSRHGKGHVLLPSEINYRANIWALKSLGVNTIVSLSAVGSLKVEIAPGDFVVVDQFVDRTKFRENTFFGNGIVGHISFGNPVCTYLSNLVFQHAKKLDSVQTYSNGTYVCIEGPAFSTRAESEMYRNFGADVIGMTNLTEAKLAREASISYASLALVTDYDCWHQSEEEVSVESVMKIMSQNIDNCKKVILSLVKDLPESWIHAEHLNPFNPIITAKEKIPENIKHDLHVIFGKYLD